MLVAVVLVAVVLVAVVLVAVVLVAVVLVAVVVPCGAGGAGQQRPRLSVSRGAAEAAAATAGRELARGAEEGRLAGCARSGGKDGGMEEWRNARLMRHVCLCGAPPPNHPPAAPGALSQPTPTGRRGRRIGRAGLRSRKRPRRAGHPPPPARRSALDRAACCMHARRPAVAGGRVWGVVMEWMALIREPGVVEREKPSKLEQRGRQVLSPLSASRWSPSGRPHA